MNLVHPPVQVHAPGVPVPVPARCDPSDIRMVPPAGHKEQRLTLPEHRGDNRDVRKMTAPRRRMIRQKNISLPQIITPVPPPSPPHHTE